MSQSQTDISANSESDQRKRKIKAWFLGPQAENAKEFKELLDEILDLYNGWRTHYAPADQFLIRAEDKDANKDVFNQLRNNVKELVRRLKFDFPFFSPRYIGHMLSEQTMPATLGYLAAMLRNPNNVTPEAASVTVRLELEVGEWVAEMLGLNPEKSWAHLCSGGTIANLEALWAARTIQFLPLCLKELCELPEFDLEPNVQTPEGGQQPLRETNAKTLIALKPSDVLKLAAEVEKQATAKYSDEAEFHTRLAKTSFSPRMRGLPAVCQALGRLMAQKNGSGRADAPTATPIIFASAARHYSVQKAAQILGYGEDSIRPVPINRRFRIDTKELKKKLNALKDYEYVAAVIGTVGTTEEGAVDEIHEIIGAREDRERRHNQSFWIHVDAAWGGYFASCFRKQRASGEPNWEEPEIQATIGDKYFPKEKFRTVAWKEPEVLKAFGAIKKADSITVDPHKTGYIPYPAGIIVFRDAGLKKYLFQRAQYIAPELTEPTEAQEESIGSYTIEGSRPGAAAAACWLAHQTIPLNADGHGLLMEECLLNARKLHYYLQYHRSIFKDLEERFGSKAARPSPFTFQPITNPDTNVVTFVAVPAAWKNGEIVVSETPLAQLNKINKEIHHELSITVQKDRPQQIQAKEFFISHTVFNKDQYEAGSLATLLPSIGVKPSDYNHNTLYLLRATVMNPFYSWSESGDDLLFKFVEHLHRVTRKVIIDVFEKSADNF